MNTEHQRLLYVTIVQLLISDSFTKISKTILELLGSMASCFCAQIEAPSSKVSLSTSMVLAEEIFADSDFSHECACPELQVSCAPRGIVRLQGQNSEQRLRGLHSANQQSRTERSPHASSSEPLCAWSTSSDLRCRNMCRNPPAQFHGQVGRSLKVAESLQGPPPPAASVSASAAPG